MSKFLTYEDRLVIAQLLQENVSFGVIGKKLGKDRTTIAKEIKKHSYDKKSGRPGYPYNPCKHRSTCKAKKLCGNSCTHQSAYKCSLCSECTLHCPDFAEDICSVKTKPPYVCNGCSQLPKCTLLKRIYDPADAHEMAHQSISESRTGILSNEDDIARINGIISPLVKNGQSLHQIYIEHVDEIMCSEKTLYNYVDAQLFDIRNIDLPRKVKYRPRYKQPEFKVDRGCRIGRSYTDFQKFLETKPESAVVQMDSVIGILSNEDDIARINGIISPLVKNGQSLHQIYIEHVDEIMCSEKTLYNYVDAQLFDIRNIDLPRKVKYRPRYKQPEFKVDRGCRIGRSYTDFQKFLETKPESAVVQMDSVIGRVGGKCLLTIHFVETSLMLAFLRDSNTSASVIQIINLLDKVLGNEDFSRLFPVILTDNGSEFSNPKAIEKRDTIPCSRTNVFYCDPSAPYQKGACEVNHELIRRILPKGSSFDDLTQKDIFLMMDHINSYKRKKLNNRSPYETFSFYYGEDILKKLGCKPVAAENIILKPKLLKK